MDSIRKQLDSVLDKLGYTDVIDGQTNDQVLARLKVNSSRWTISTPKPLTNS